MQDVTKTYRIVQEAANIRFKLKRCRAKLSRTAFTCHTNYEGITAEWHYLQSPIDQEWLFAQDYKLTESVCTRLWEQGEYQDPFHADRIYKVNRPGFTNVITHSGGGSREKAKYTECTRGHIWPSRGPEYWGQDFWSTADPRTEYYHGHVTDYTDITLDEVEAVQGVDGSVTLLHERVVLPCDVKEEKCATDADGTFLWRAPSADESCRYFSSLPEAITGLELIDAHGRTKFYNEENILRLEKRNSFSRCGSVLFRTDFDNLFLTEDLENEKFQRDIPTEEISTVTYANQQDSFLYQEVVDYVRRELAQLKEQQCKSVRNNKKGEYARQAAEQQAILEGETTMVAPNQFVTAAGEVWYTYHCRPLTVMAKTDGQCYSGLPVELSSHDLQRYHENMEEKEEEKEEQLQNAPRTERKEGVDADTDSMTPDPLLSDLDFFIEPKTHRLVTVAAEIECAPPIVPIYKNIHGDWIAWDGVSLYKAPPPLPLERINWVFPEEEELAKNFNWGQAGIYTPKAVKKMEKFRQTPRAAQALGVTLARQSRHRYRRRPITAHDLFSDVPTSSFLQRISITEWFWTFIERWGRLCSIFICCGLLFRFVTWACGVFIRLCAAPITGSLFKHVFSAFFPSFRDFLRDEWLVGCATQTTTPAKPNSEDKMKENNIQRSEYYQWRKELDEMKQQEEKKEEEEEQKNEHGVLLRSNNDG